MDIGKKQFFSYGNLALISVETTLPELGERLPHKFLGFHDLANDKKTRKKGHDKMEDELTEKMAL